MNSTPSLRSVQSSAAERQALLGFIRSAVATTLLGAALMTFSVTPANAASADTTKKQPTQTQTQAPAFSWGHLRDNHRVYNPNTGNFEEAPPFGPRTNK